MDANCVGCKKLVVNWDPFDCVLGYVGPPLCLSCISRMESQMFPEITAAESVALFLTWDRAEHERVRTRGFDPYVGDRWVVRFGQLELGADSTICWHVWAKWRGRSIAEFFGNERRDFQWNPLAAAMVWLHGVLEEERERTYVEDPMGCLADYE